MGKKFHGLQTPGTVRRPWSSFGGLYAFGIVELEAAVLTHVANLRK